MKLACLVVILADAFLSASVTQATINDEMMAVIEMAEAIPELKNLACKEIRD